MTLPSTAVETAIDDLRKSRGLHSVSAYRHGPYIQVHACGCSDDDDDELMLNVLRCHLTY